MTPTTPGPIAPHGGILVDRLDPALDEGGNRPRVTLSARQQADLDLIAVGAMSPLDGFMDRKAYESVITDMRLPSGLAWSVPVTLAVQPDEHHQVTGGARVGGSPQLACLRTDRDDEGLTRT